MITAADQWIKLTGIGLLADEPQFNQDLGARVQVDFGLGVLFAACIKNQDLPNIKSRLHAGSAWHLQGECYLNSVRAGHNRTVVHPIIWTDSFAAYRSDGKTPFRHAELNLFGVVEERINAIGGTTVLAVVVENLRKQGNYHNRYEVEVRVPEGLPVPETGHSILAFGRLDFVAVEGGGAIPVIHAHMVHDAGVAVPQEAASAAARAPEPAPPAPAAAEAPQAPPAQEEPPPPEKPKQRINRISLLMRN